MPERFYKYSPTGDRANWERGTWDTIDDSSTTLTVWISDTVGEIGITPDFRAADLPHRRALAARECGP